MSYQALREGKLPIPKIAAGLRRDDQDFEHLMTLDHAGAIEVKREKYELFAYVQPQVNHLLTHRTLMFRNPNNAPIEIDLAVSDEGVAFRYYHAAGPYTPAYEDFFFNVSPGEPPPDSRAKAVGWAFPALFHVPDAGIWALITESGTDESYCGCHLAADSSHGLYRIAFPLADQATKGWTNKFGPEPRYALPWTMPWRVIVMGTTAGDITMSTLVTDLAPPSQIADASWIKPGRASWAWWAYPEGPPTAKLFNDFSDFAAKRGWEYTLFDAGWWKPGLKDISDYAQSRESLRWLGCSPPISTKTRKSDRKNWMKWLPQEFAGESGFLVLRSSGNHRRRTLFQDAAARKIVVNLHGCTIPRGWQRTWPNFLTCEAVLGTESYFYEPQYTAKAAELNTVLPFTRNAIGPMDSTPVACTPKKYARTPNCRTWSTRHHSQLGNHPLRGQAGILRVASACGLADFS